MGKQDTPAPRLSVVMAQYRPDKRQLKHALDSLLMQDTRDFEFIVCDDGSPQDWFGETRRYLAAHGFTNVRFCKNETNQGTVINLWNGVKAARGEWIIGLTPGDYFYDASTVSWVLETIGRDAPEAAFGKTAYYYDVRPDEPRQCPGDTPMDRTCYDPAHYNARRVLRNLLLYSDHICGASAFCRRDRWLWALEQMAGRVKYAEDFSTLLFAAAGVPIRLYDRVIRWYEYGTGISTDKNSASEQRLQADLRAVILLLREKHPKDRTVWLACQYFFNDRHRSRLLRGLIGRAIVPQWLPFKRAQRNWQPPANGDVQKLLELYQYNQGEPL